jgi:hypothetical protein
VSVTTAVHPRLFVSSHAWPEGWDLFDADHVTTPVDHCAPWPTEVEWCELELQRDDSAGHFDDDTEAWVHVLGRAIDGSRPHLLALGLLAGGNPTELARILEHRDDH